MTPPRIRQLVIAANSLDTAEKLQDILGLGTGGTTEILVNCKKVLIRAVE